MNKQEKTNEQATKKIQLKKWIADQTRLENLVNPLAIDNLNKKIAQLLTDNEREFNQAINTVINKTMNQFERKVNKMRPLFISTLKHSTTWLSGKKWTLEDLAKFFKDDSIRLRDIIRDPLFPPACEGRIERGSSNIDYFFPPKWYAADVIRYTCGLRLKGTPKEKSYVHPPIRELSVYSEDAQTLECIDTDIVVKNDSTNSDISIEEFYYDLYDVENKNIIKETLMDVYDQIKELFDNTLEEVIEEELEQLWRELYYIAKAYQRTVSNDFIEPDEFLIKDDDIYDNISFCGYINDIMKNDPQFPRPVSFHKSQYYYPNYAMWFANDILNYERSNNDDDSNEITIK